MALLKRNTEGLDFKDLTIHEAVAALIEQLAYASGSLTNTKVDPASAVQKVARNLNIFKRNLDNGTYIKQMEDEAKAIAAGAEVPSDEQADPPEPTGSESEKASPEEDHEAT